VLSIALAVVISQTNLKPDFWAHGGVGFAGSAGTYWFAAETGAPRSTRIWGAFLVPPLFCLGWEIGGIRAGRTEADSIPDMGACFLGTVLGAGASLALDLWLNPKPQRLLCHDYEYTEFGVICDEDGK
jgi:hypothetical protein